MTATACATNSPTWQPSRIVGLTYPRLALLANLGGEVEAKCLIDAAGSVSRVEIISGHPLLNSAVESNLKRWTFRREDKYSVGPEWFTVIYEFRKAGACIDGYCKEEIWIEYPDRVVLTAEVPRLIG